MSIYYNENEKNSFRFKHIEVSFEMPRLFVSYYTEHCFYFWWMIFIIYLFINDYYESTKMRITVMKVKDQSKIRREKWRRNIRREPLTNYRQKSTMSQVTVRWGKHNTYQFRVEKHKRGGIKLFQVNFRLVDYYCYRPPKRMYHA